MSGQVIWANEVALKSEAKPNIPEKCQGRLFKLLMHHPRTYTKVRDPPMQ